MTLLNEIEGRAAGNMGLAKVAGSVLHRHPDSYLECENRHLHKT